MNKKKLTIGLFGFGCVGYGLWEVLSKTPGFHATIKHICIKDPHKKRPIPNDIFCTEKEVILNDPDINVIVELIDDANAAYSIVVDALKKGKAVVSANKKMIAENISELIALQKKYNTPFLYEAACCASLPIIRNLEEYYDNDLLESLEGIVNGSTNYILTQTSEGNTSYADALLQAQQLGYAESDHQLDTEGFDAKYKLLLLIAHAFGTIVKPEDIINFGINQIDDFTLSYAKEKKLKIKLIAKAYRDREQNIHGYVMPKFVDERHPLYNVDDVYNGIVTNNLFSDKQFFVGKGAGAYPTASAVLSDISALSYAYKYEYKKYNNSHKPSYSKDSLLKIWISSIPESKDLINYYFKEILESFSSLYSSYFIGTITLCNLIELKHILKESSSVILVEDDQNGISSERLSLEESKFENAKQDFSMSLT